MSAGPPLLLPTVRRLRRLDFQSTVLAGALGIGLLTASACSGDTDPDPPSGRCGALAEEKLDSRSLQHVFPGAPPPAFTSEQPTSGPHSPVERAGIQSEPLSPVVQVALLEEGSILLQHQGLDDAALTRLEALAGPEVIVAPGRDLPNAVVATAWTVKLRCDGVEDKALRSFIDRFEGKGFGPG